MSAWADTAPSKECLLRQEYPDLEEKWATYQCHKQIFSSIDKKLNKFGMIKRLFNSKEYNRIRITWMETKILCEDASREYQLLEKLYWDY